MSYKLYLVDHTILATIPSACYSIFDYQYRGPTAAEMQENALTTEITLDMSDPAIGDVSVNTLGLSIEVFSKLEKAAWALGYEVVEWK